MLFQEGRDVGAVLFPMLFVVGLCLLGLVIWLIIILTRTKKDQDVQSVNQQLADVAGNVPPYILAIGRTGTQWDIYVKGVRAYADTIFDTTTRKEALEALRVLARYARERLRVVAEPIQATPESTPQKLQVQPAARIDLTSISDTQPSVFEPVDYPSVSPNVTGMNLAQEIGEIVDEMIAKTPSLQDHAVDLIGAQTEGINFVVDGAVYNEVEDIPNPEIRELIRRATREWGRR